MSATRRLGLTGLLAAYAAVDRGAALHQAIRCAGFPRFDAVERELPAGGTVLDLGCGFGLMSILAAARDPRRRVLGLDRLGSRLAIARRVADRLRLDNLDFVTGTLERIPDRAFDAIVIMDVLLYRPLSAQEAVLAACRARLRPGGRLIVKEQVRAPSWKARLVELQERLVVGLKHGRERGEGAWTEMAPSGTHLWDAQDLVDAVARQGLSARGTRLDAWCYLSHHLVIGAAPPT